MTVPLSLYIHVPWCVKKCPYCDFNSHTQQGELPEKAYIDQLVMDLQTQLSHVQNRQIHSIFIGGGTPSLFAPKSYADLLSRLQAHVVFEDNIEITLEANPGTTDSSRLSGYFDAGINRVSIGVQSFQDDKLKILGRIHESDHAKNAVIAAQKAGFTRINIDLMFGLPTQTIDDALFDLQTAIDLSTSHLSWYQLTLEPNTYFHRFPPTLPSDDARFAMQETGQALLREKGFAQYEISAYGLDRCRHNLNYWSFGDYLGIGAGAHAKLTTLKTMEITRRMSLKNPKQYLQANTNNIAESKLVTKTELPLEFMMNALRLYEPISIASFQARTGLPLASIENPLRSAVNLGLLSIENNAFFVTKHGKLFLNDLLELFV